MRARCAGRDSTKIGTFKPIFDRNLPRHHVRNKHRYKEGRDPARTMFMERDGLVIKRDHTSDTRPDDYGYTVFINFFEIKFRIPDRFFCGNKRILTYFVQTPCFFALEIIQFVVIFNLGGKLCWKVLRVKMLDGPGPALS